MDMERVAEVGRHIESLAGTTGLDPEEVIELLRLFCDTSRADLEQMGEAFESGDFRQICDRAHSVKGAALNLSLGDLARAAASVEDCARRGAGEKARLSFNLLLDRFAAVRTALGSY